LIADTKLKRITKIHIKMTNFLDVTSYKHLQEWANNIKQREAVQRGRIVNCTWGQPWQMLAERHSAEDITQVLKLRAQ
jgi:GST-like protein